MNKEIKNADGADPSDRSPDPNRPSGAARRRLLRALGGSGGALLGVVLASKWRKPVVEAVVLPAHAQTSGLPPSAATGCQVTLEATFAGVPSGNSNAGRSMTLFVSGANSTTLATGSTAGFDPLTLSGSSTFPPGSYSAAFSTAHDFLATGSFQLRVACCDATAVAEFQQLDPDDPSLFWPNIVIDDDGECSFVGG